MNKYKNNKSLSSILLKYSFIDKDMIYNISDKTHISYNVIFNTLMSLTNINKFELENNIFKRIK